MDFWFGLLTGFVGGLLFTVWNDRQKWNACSKGGFHFWMRYPREKGWSDGDRYCAKCGIDEERNWWGQWK
jgi:hypothetical protein